ncbi:hypothetical protein Bca4012_103379 [Brassica carinata]
MHRHHATRGALPAAGPYLRLSPDFDFHDHRPAVLIDQHPLWVLVSLRPPPEFLWLRPARHSSPSFGPDKHAHTRTLHIRSTSVGSSPVIEPTNQLPYALRDYSPDDSHTCQTPWSVFQDGSNGEPTGRRPEHADAEARLLIIYTSRYLFAIGLSPIFSLDGIYRPIGAAFPNNPTRRQRLVVRQGPGTTGSHLSGAPFQGTWARSVAEDASPDYTNAEDVRFSSWALPGSLAVTKGILVSFFSSAY